MYGYIYKTTNLVNNKIYIGQKKSDIFLGNRYLGSGKLLRRAVNKYGEENFKVELIEEVELKDDMDKREIFWISYYNATNSAIGYNVSEGGNVNRTMVGENNPFYGKHHTEDTVIKIKKCNRGKIPWNKGLTKETDTRVKAYTENNKRRGERVKNTVWINNTKISKMVSKSDLDYFLNSGWVIGRLPLPKESYKNLALGKIRINNGDCEKNIHKEELSNYLELGWKRGRLKIKDTSNYGKHRSKKVLCVETGVIYDSIRQVKSELGINCSSCCNGKRQTAGGFHWKFVDK